MTETQQQAGDSHLTKGDKSIMEDGNGTATSTSETPAKMLGDSISTAIGNKQPQVDAEPKCYTFIRTDSAIKPSLKEEFVKEYLSGEYDKEFKGPNGVPSKFFNFRFDEQTRPIYNDTIDDERNVYILELGYSIDEVNRIAANGQFSKSILRAKPREGWKTGNYGIINENFSSDLLEATPSEQSQCKV